ncbi:YezD family protein [Caryophanon tenue]|nr:YezD family protein [Caryophanon tenue]
MDKRKENHEATIENLRKLLRDLQYGSVTLVVQDNYIVQIEKNEKIRLK